MAPADSAATKEFDIPRKRIKFGTYERVATGRNMKPERAAIVPKSGYRIAVHLWGCCKGGFLRISYMPIVLPTSRIFSVASTWRSADSEDSIDYSDKACDMK
jgi:hypothetical protein